MPLKRDVTIYFVRHGETDWNAVGRYQGQTDTTLNDKGRGQAARNGQILARHFGTRQDLAFVASPLARTRETMSILRRELGLEPEPFPMDDRLKEIHFGHWEGRIWKAIREETPHEWSARKADPFRWRPNAGESYADLALRVHGWLAGLERDTVVVSHGGVSRVVRGHVLRLAEADIPIQEVPQDKVMVLRAGHLEWM